MKKLWERKAPKAECAEWVPIRAGDIPDPEERTRFLAENAGFGFVCHYCGAENGPEAQQVCWDGHTVTPAAYTVCVNCNAL